MTWVERTSPAVEVDGSDVVVVGQREDPCASVRRAEAEVANATVAADGHLELGVEPVVAQTVVAVWP